MSRKTKFIVAGALVVIGVVSRLIPHPWNTTPILALALFSGAYLGRSYSVSVPLSAMLVSDTMIGFASWQVTWSVYAGFFVAGLLGNALRRVRTVETVLASSIVGSTFFYLITNWAVWQFADWYPHTVQGLIASYVAALPFFRNMLLGDLIYTSLFFGAYELLTVYRYRKIVHQAR